MRLLTLNPTSLKPAKGLSHAAHLGLLVVLPLAVFILVRAQFVEPALALIILSKWRMLAVQPRFWLANIRANAIDIVVGISILVFMVNASSVLEQFIWTILYTIWLVYIKPASGVLATSFQAGIGQLCGLTALFLGWSGGSLYVLVFATGLICYLAGRHFFDGFDEPYARLLAYTWAYFGAALMWVLGHWLLFYYVVAQPTLVLSVLGYGMAALYYLSHRDRLSVIAQRQILAIMIVVIGIILVFSDWNNKII